MIGYGRACAACKGGKCRDRRTSEDPLCIPVAGGDDIEVTGCPTEYAGRTGFDAVKYARLLRLNLPPVAGGALDQSSSAMEAIEFVESQRSEWKNQLGIIE